MSCACKNTAEVLLGGNATIHSILNVTKTLNSGKTVCDNIVKMFIKDEREDTSDAESQRKNLRNTEFGDYSS